MRTLSIISTLLAALFSAIADTLHHHFSVSVFAKLNPTFWNPAISWVNKYEGGEVSNGPAFFGSTTFLVWLTDGWHLANFFFLKFIFVAVVFYRSAKVTELIKVSGLAARIYYKMPVWLRLALDFFIWHTVFALSFELAYRVLG